MNFVVLESTCAYVKEGLTNPLEFDLLKPPPCTHSCVYQIYRIVCNKHYRKPSLVTVLKDSSNFSFTNLTASQFQKKKQKKNIDNIHTIFYPLVGLRNFSFPLSHSQSVSHTIMLVRSHFLSFLNCRIFVNSSFILGLKIHRLDSPSFVDSFSSMIFQLVAVVKIWAITSLVWINIEDAIDLRDFVMQRHLVRDVTLKFLASCKKLNLILSLQRFGERKLCNKYKILFHCSDYPF